MNNQSSNKRKRCSNYTYKEIEVLLRLVKQYQNAIESKKTDSLTNSQKDAAWERLTVSFNNLTENHRSKDNLRSKWDSLKKSARKSFSTKLTEGDAPSSTLNPLENKVLAIIGAIGKHNSFICDNEDSETGVTEINLETIKIESSDCFNETISERSDLNSVTLQQPLQQTINTQNELEIDHIINANTVDESTNLNYNERVRHSSYRRKKSIEKKEILTKLAEKKIELVKLQIQLLKDEHETRMKLLEEKHEIEIQILKTELDIKKSRVR